MAKKSKQYIVTLEQGKKAIYTSIAEASKALGVDAANIRKVLSGQRKSAGGYHFAAYTNLKDITNADLHRREVEREERAVDKDVTRALIDTVHDRLVSLNRMFRSAKKENLYQEDEVLQKLMKHSEYYGQNKQGGYITTKQHLRRIAAAEGVESLENLLTLLTTTQEEYIDQEYYTNKKGRNLASYSTMFGTTDLQTAKYWHLLPVYFDFVEAAKTSTEFRYSDVKEQIHQYMQDDYDPTQLYSLIKELTNVAKGTSKQTLKEIMAKYEPEEVQKTWKQFGGKQRGNIYD